MHRRSVLLVMLLAASICATPAVAASHTAPILREGMRGPGVRHLQRRLHVRDTGFFGRVTLLAVERFQRRHGLLVDGQVGPHTRRALHADWVRRRAHSVRALRVRERRHELGRAPLRIGMTGPRVTELQRLLGITADGVFGPHTRAAVLRFQRRHGIRPVGFVGPRTRRALAAAARPPRRGHTRGAHSPHVFRLGMHGVRIAQLQVRLGIAADGVFGPAMLSAVRRFQAQHGLRADGRIGPATLRAIRRSPHGRSAAVRAAVMAVGEIGRPYVFGGASPRGFDCSGLVMWAYRRAGIAIPRTTYQQFGELRLHPRLGALRAGDLVFFSGRSHVGLYLGHRLLVRAPHTGARVGIARLSGWFLRHWSGAARVVS